VFNPDSNVTVDGVPNDATGLDDIGEGDGSGGGELPDPGEGMNVVSDETGVELAKNIPRPSEVSVARDVGDYPISDELLEEAHEAVGSALSRARNQELAREYAKRTLFIGDDADRSNNASLEANDTVGNRMALDNDGQGPTGMTVQHEMGHGMMQMYNLYGTNNEHAWNMNFFPEADLRSEEFSSLYMQDDPVRTDGNNPGIGVPDWEDDVIDSITGASFQGPTADLTGLEPGDLVKFTESPKPGNQDQTTRYEIVDRTEPDDPSELGATYTYVARDRNGYETEFPVKPDLIGDDAEVPGFGPSIENTNKAFSSKTAARNREKTDFTSRGEPDVETVQKMIEEASGLAPEEYQRKLAEESNRAFLRMHTAFREFGPVEARKFTIGSGYSSTNAGEVPSMLHEEMGLASVEDRESALERYKADMKKMATNQPRLLGTYLAGFEPTDIHRQAINELGDIEL
jgi:hypothetical protein